jgi:hypothetical protein
MRVTIAVPSGLQIQEVSASNGASLSVADPVSGTIELAVPIDTTGAIDLTALFMPIASRVVPNMLFADAGSAVRVGTIDVTIAAGGNRSIQMRSVAGTMPYAARVCHSSGGTTAASGNLGTAWTYLVSTWHFGAAGQWQEMLFDDNSSGRRYKVRAMIGPSYVANTFWIEEIL